MGNCHCAPRLKGENTKNFIQRKFFPKSRKRKIDKLAEQSIHGNEQSFRRIAGGIKLTDEEIDHYYTKRDAIVHEFNDDVIEIEIYDYGHESPSEYGETDSEEYETDLSEYSSYRPEITSVTPQFENPIMQQMYEEYGQKEWAKKLDMVSLYDLQGLDEYQDLPIEEASVTTNECNTMMTLIKGNQDRRSETTGIILETTAAQIDDENDTDGESESEMIKSTHNITACEYVKTYDNSRVKAHDGFRTGENTKNNNKDIKDIENECKRSNIKHEGKLNSVKKNQSGMLENNSKVTKVSNKTVAKCKGSHKELSKPETQQDNKDERTNQHNHTHDRFSSERYVHEHLLTTDGQIHDFKRRLYKSLKSFRSPSKSDRNVIHVKPARPETRFDNCRN